MKPIFSFVVALIFTSSGFSPNRWPMLLFIFSTKGAILGLSATITASMFLTVYLFFKRSPPTSSSRIRLEIPFHFGSPQENGGRGLPPPPPREARRKPHAGGHRRRSILPAPFRSESRPLPKYSGAPRPAGGRRSRCRPGS